MGALASSEPRSVSPLDLAWRRSYNFDAFVSYSRKNLEFARRLSDALSRYAAPGALDPSRQRVRIFLDTHDLSGVEYHDSINQQLKASAKLIVICSPEASSSEYVNDEIRSFRRLHAARDLVAEAAIIPVLFRGLPNNEATDKTQALAAFPPELCLNNAIPLAVDYRDIDVNQQHLNRAPYEASWHKLLANLFGTTQSVIEERESRRQLRDRRRVITILSTALLILSLLLVFALTSRHSAVLARAAAEKSAAGESDARQLAESRQREAEKATIAANLAQANERTQRDIAVQQRDLAIARQLAVRSQSLLADRSQDDESAALLAIASIRIKPTFENDFALRQATSLLPVQVFAVSTGPSVFSIALSPGAHYLATGSSNGNVVRVFSLRRGKEIDELDIDGPCRALAFSPDDEYLAASGKDNIYIKLPRIKEKPQRIHYSSPFLSFTKDRRYLIAGSALFELPTGREVIRFSAAEKTSHAQISRDGETLFIQKSDGRITISDISSGKEIQKIEHLLGAEVKANFVNNGQYVAALNDWETAGVYDVSSGKEITRVKEDSPIQLMALTPGGRPSLFLTVSSGNMRMVQNPGGSELWRLHSDVVEAYFTPDGKRLVTQGLSAARVFEAFDGKEVAHVTCHGGSMYASAVDESGKYLATACNKVGDDPGERVIRVFEMAPASGSNGPELTKRSRRQTHLDSAGIRLGEHYRQEGAGPPSFDEVVRVVDATKGRLVSRVHHSEGTSVATFSPDSRYVALGGVFGAVGVYVIQTGKLQCRYSQEHNDIGVIVFSGNSRRFAVESRGTVTILEVANCEVISKIQPPHGRDAHDPKLNFDGSVLTTFGRETMGPFVVSAAQDLTDRYSLDPVEMIRDACARVTRNLTRAEWTEYVGGSAPFQKVCPNLQSRSSEGNVR